MPVQDRCRCVSTYAWILVQNTCIHQSLAEVDRTLCTVTASIHCACNTIRHVSTCTALPSKESLQSPLQRCVPVQPSLVHVPLITYVFTYVRCHICIYAYTHIHAHICMHTYAYMYARNSMYICSHIHVYAHAFIL